MTVRERIEPSTDQFQPVGDQPQPALDLEAAADLIKRGALFEQPVGGVGLELEGHVFDSADLERPVDLTALQDLQQDWPCLPGGGRLSVEPGGQLEVSSACEPGAAAAITAMRADVTVVRHWLAERGLGWVFLGTDPLRQARHVNRAPRYAAMQKWFAAAHSGSDPAAAATMMCSTAALQVNLDSGYQSQWRRRVDRAQRLVPVLTALTGNSSHLQGGDTGWCSARQRAWSGLDPLTSGPLPGAEEPMQEWVQRAFDAPVMLVASQAGLRAAERRRSLRDWVSDPEDWPPPTAADVRRHLTTLFPPVRLRGWLELRCMDSLPDDWWPAVVASVVAWMDASEIDESVAAVLAAGSRPLGVAARLGLADAELRELAEALLTLALPCVSAPVRPEVATLLDMVRAAQTPGSVRAADMRRRGPAAVIRELIHG